MEQFGVFIAQHPRLMWSQLLHSLHSLVLRGLLFFEKTLAIALVAESMLLSVSQTAQASQVSLLQLSTLPRASIMQGTDVTLESVPIQYLGGGLLFASEITPLFQIEYGALFYQRGFHLKALNGQRQEFHFSVVQIPLAFRCRIIPALGVGLGFYADWALGGLPYTTGGLNTLDDGYFLSLDIKLPLNSLLALRFEGRFVYGIPPHSLNSFSSRVATRDFQVGVGLTLNAF